jgi:hypothetical protein
MKTQRFQKSLVVAAAVLLAINAMAQNSATTGTTVAPPTAGSQAAPQLSYGVPQILQLAQAKVGDDTIVAYIQNSGTVYGLDASQIVYLRQQGVSDRVVTTMLNQRNNVAASAAQTGTQAPAQNYSAGSAQTSTAVAQPTVTYLQTVPSSSVYVIPDTQTYNYGAYYYQPYYYPGYAWPYPAVSLSFGFGGRWGGGFHGGGFRGGGWHR